MVPFVLAFATEITSIYLDLFREGSLVFDGFENEFPMTFSLKTEPLRS